MYSKLILIITYYTFSKEDLGVIAICPFDQH
jgi:hypothetical protein